MQNVIRLGCYVVQLGSLTTCQHHMDSVPYNHSSLTVFISDSLTTKFGLNSSQYLTADNNLKLLGLQSLQWSEPYGSFTPYPTIPG